MSDLFSMRLSQLRREKHVSQKDAAKSLGVSQALLSHYENGIRECGLDFIVKAADYYDVTCDYLLGRSTNKYGYIEGVGKLKECPEDKYLSSPTVCRAAFVLREYLSVDEETSFHALVLFSVCLYRLMGYGVVFGKIPANWLNIKNRRQLTQHLNIADSLLFRFLSVDTQMPKLLFSDEPMPLSLKTVIDATYTAFERRINQLSDNIGERRRTIDSDDIEEDTDDDEE